MVLQTVRSFLKRRKTVDSAHHEAFAKLLPAEKFRAVLERERARADRTGDRFSLLVLSSNGSPDRNSVLAPAATVLKDRLRSTDEAGWMENGRVGVVLPSTPHEGAEALARDVLQKIPDELLHPEHQIYTYPMADFADGDGDLQHREDGPVEEPVSSPYAVYAVDSLLQQPMPLWKRGLDVVGAAIGLIVLSPLLLAVAAAVKLTSPGPIFFRQLRSGYGGAPFVIYKFRSMVDGAERSRNSLAGMNEQDGPAFKIRSDPRVTPVGRLLRATSIDELPQLWNVLRGDMSLVGPRPLPCGESKATAGWQRRRLDVTPGLTCIWQTSDRRSISFNEWMRMDLRYLRSRSIRQDVKLILTTVLVVFRGKRW